jgi:hypothetical protein
MNLSERGWKVAIVATQFREEKLSLKSFAIVSSSLPVRHSVSWHNEQDKKFTLKPFSKANRRAERKTKSSQNSANFFLPRKGQL